MKLLNDISLIDDSVLIKDDFLDGSKYRNGKLCLYKKIGVEQALIKSEHNRCNSINALFKLMNLCNTSLDNRLKILENHNNFISDVYAGELVDLSLKKNKSLYITLLKKYKNMISLFTGGHIKYAVKIGFLLVNNNCNDNIENICVSSGRIRQVCDDFDDYYEKHHESFGDFINNKNRLPELLFNKNNGNRKKVLKLINLKKHDVARDLILTKKVKADLYNFCLAEYNNIKKLNKKVNFNYLDILIDFNYILNDE